MRALVLSLALLLVTGPVLAAAPKKSEHGPPKSEGASRKPTLDPRGVDIPAVTVPLVKKDRLAEYAFVGLRLLANSPEEAEKAKADLPLVQDAIVRALNVRPLDQALPDEALKAAVLERVKAALEGALPGRIQEVVVKDLVRTRA